MSPFNRLMEKLHVLILVLFLSGPMLVFASKGPEDRSAFGTSQTEFPPLLKLIAPRSKGREKIADAIFDRSLLQREAVAMRNRFSWYQLGFIEERRIVSGAPGWLFYKPAFAAWDCSKHESARSGLQRLAFLLELAEANSLSLAIASAPNKASIQSREVVGRAKHRSRCYFEFEREYRAMMRRYASSRLIDHAVVLEPRTRTSEPYLRLDTHWARLASFAAISQLVKESGVGNLPPLDLPRFMEEKSTDLGNQMLLLDEQVFDQAVSVAGIMNADQAPGSSEEIVILHDSFYHGARDYLEAMIPGVRLVNYRNAEEELPSLEDVDFLILESVERAILTRVYSQDYWGWNGWVGEWVLSGMGRESRNCRWDLAEDLLAGVATYDLTLSEDGSAHKNGLRPRLVAEMPLGKWTGRVCLEVALEVGEEQKIQIFLSTTDPLFDSDVPRGELEKFVEARSVEGWLDPSNHSLSFVLPRENVDRRLRLDFDAPFDTTRILRLRVAPRN